MGKRSVRAAVQMLNWQRNHDGRGSGDDFELGDCDLRERIAFRMLRGGRGRPFEGC